MASPIRLTPLLVAILATAALAVQGPRRGAEASAPGLRSHARPATPAQYGGLCPAVQRAPDSPLTQLFAAASPFVTHRADRPLRVPATPLGGRPRRSLGRQIAAAGVVATAAVAACAVLEWGGRNTRSRRPAVMAATAYPSEGPIAGAAAKPLAGRLPDAASHHLGGWGASDYLSAAIISVGVALPFLPGLGNDEGDDSRVSVRPMGRRPGLLWLIGLGR